jgi:hypothetical protein
LLETHKSLALADASFRPSSPRYTQLFPSQASQTNFSALQTTPSCSLLAGLHLSRLSSVTRRSPNLLLPLSPLPTPAPSVLPQHAPPPPPPASSSTATASPLPFLSPPARLRCPLWTPGNRSNALQTGRTLRRRHRPSTQRRERQYPVSRRRLRASSTCATSGSERSAEFASVFSSRRG